MPTAKQILKKKQAKMEKENLTKFLTNLKKFYLKIKMHFSNSMRLLNLIDHRLYRTSTLKMDLFW